MKDLNTLIDIENYVRATKQSLWSIRSLQSPEVF